VSRLQRLTASPFGRGRAAGAGEGRTFRQHSHLGLRPSPLPLSRRERGFIALQNRKISDCRDCKCAFLAGHHIDHPCGVRDRCGAEALYDTVAGKQQVTPEREQSCFASPRFQAK